MYIYMYKYICVFIHTYVQKLLPVDVHTLTCNGSLHVLKPPNIRMDVCITSYVCINIWTTICVCMYACLYMRICVFRKTARCQTA